jgi:hypothetical protein
VLLGRGDGTFEPQRRFDATVGAFALAVGDVDGDGTPDLVVVGSTGGQGKIAVLLGRGDGTFRPPLLFDSPVIAQNPIVSVQLTDLNRDGRLDMLVGGEDDPSIYVLLGNGDGTFRAGPNIPVSASALGVADLNKDGIPDVVSASDAKTGAYDLGRGDGTFQDPQPYTAGEGTFALTVADFGSAVTQGDQTVLGPPDGIPDLLLAASGVSVGVLSGPPQVLFYPGKVDAQGNFTGFGSPIVLASPKTPIDIKVADFNGDGSPDVALVVQDGIQVIYGKPPSGTATGDPNLGTVVHVIEPALTIVPGHEEEDYTLTVPTEAAHGSGDEVLDFSGDFQATSGAGITMQVSDSAGNVLGSGERFRVRASQGAHLTLRVFGVTDSQGNQGAGAYTLDIDVLPQVVSAEAQPLLPGVGGNPGGPTASLVVTLQGDRLDPASAENPANYTVTWAGPDGVFGTADDQVIPLASGQSVVYDPSANVDVASGTTYPTAVRQTVTLLFDQPLPAGSYQVQLAPAIQTAAFNADEANLLSGGAAFAGHPVVSLSGGQVVDGSQVLALDLVHAAGALGSLDVFKQGTPFLTQLHDDLAALLDSALTQQGDAPTITAALTGQVQQRFDPALGQAGQRPTGALVLVLDPVGISSLTDQQNNQVSYDLQDNTLTNTFDNGFVDVVGSLEVVVLPTGGGTFTLSVNNVPASARGGVVFAGLSGDQVVSLTDQLRSGQSVFNLSF